jgi:itaconate CoA-transferase
MLRWSRSARRAPAWWLAHSSTAVGCRRHLSSAAAAAAPPPLPLEGKLVVSMEQAVAAPYCTSRMADAGARVIKIERPEGDFARGYDKFANGLSSYFVWLNRGKESLVANIKDEEDRALLYEILAKADVFVQNLAPGAAARAGLGSAELRERFPQLVCVDISGYGEGNAYSNMKAYDLLVQAEAGLSSVTGQAGGSVGGRVGVSICDIGCGMYCYSAVLEALMSRELVRVDYRSRAHCFDYEHCSPYCT